MGPARAKPLSPLLIDTLLPVLGIRLVIVDDPEAIAAIEGRWERRDETNVRACQRVSRRIVDRARPVVLRGIIELLQQEVEKATAMSRARKKTPAELRPADSAAEPIVPQAKAVPIENTERPTVSVPQRGAPPIMHSHLRIIQQSKSRLCGTARIRF